MRNDAMLKQVYDQSMTIIPDWRSISRMEGCFGMRTTATQLSTERVNLRTPGGSLTISYEIAKLA